MKKGLTGAAMAEYNKFGNLRMIYPFVNEWEKINSKKMKY